VRWLAKSLLDYAASDRFAPAQSVTAQQLQTIATLRQPPVYAAAQTIWYQCKALELAVTFLMKPEEELFCTCQQRMAQERVEQVKMLLQQNLVEPPSLEELGRKIGCSHFYLSRIFSTHTGQTITQHLRQLRMEKAARLLQSGEYNVTEAALERLLEMEDHDLWELVSGRRETGDPQLKGMIAKLHQA